MKQEQVANWMTTKVITISPHTTLSEAHRLMTDNQVRRLPVVENDCLIGILTLGDVRGTEPSEATSLSIWEVNYLLAKMEIKQTMTRNPVTIHPQMTISEAAKIMLAHKISGLPVVNDRQEIVGIITESDIFRLLVRAWYGELSHDE